MSLLVTLAVIGSLDPTVVALVGTLFGGVGLKIAESWLNKKRVMIDDASRIRDELRLEINALRTENTGLDANVDKWREAYYNLYEKYISMRTEARMQGVNLPDEDLPRPD